MQLFIFDSICRSMCHLLNRRHLLSSLKIDRTVNSLSFVRKSSFCSSTICLWTGEGQALFSTVDRPCSYRRLSWRRSCNLPPPSTTLSTITRKSTTAAVSSLYKQTLQLQSGIYIEIVIIIAILQKRHLKAKLRTPAYSRASLSS